MFLVSFGVAPAVLAFVIGLRTEIDTFILSIFVCGGIARLARFNVTAHSVPQDDIIGERKYFQGLPIPSSLCLVLLMWFWVEYGYLINGKVPLGQFRVFSYDGHYFSLVFAIWTAFMVSKTLKVPKF
jgi:CDP-diacylglycerol--serine O-phosphatidyltransferase